MKHYTLTMWELVFCLIHCAQVLENTQITDGLSGTISYCILQVSF